MDQHLESFIRGIPKAELHIHIEGSLEPEMMFEMAVRNEVELAYPSVAALRAAYEFTDLQSFLDIYYAGAAVLQTEQDFYDLMSAYLVRADADGVRRAEIYFDPQTHTERGIGFEVFMPGFLNAMADAEAASGISSGLIMSFLRHLSPEAARNTLEAAAPYHHQLLGVGLDSSEIGNPPEPFAPVFEQARRAGLHRVAHAGEEGPPAYVVGALDALGAERIDHGVRADEDPALVEFLADNSIPLTMCPLSNLKLRVFDQLEDHNLKRLLDAGIKVTINSDDPAYFGGYVAANYIALCDPLKLTRADVATLARNSLEAAFLDDVSRKALLDELASYVARY
jgi:adenosine deaminase